jgi:hypothetical protein
VKAVSVSAELLNLERAVQGVADRLDVTTIDTPVTEEHQRQATAVLNLIACRLRDLGRAARGRFAADLFWTHFNSADEDADGEDFVIYPPAPQSKVRK